MYTTTISPRFCDTDALGHISNTAYVEWLEHARTELFRIFNPTLSLKDWPLILARVELDFLAQAYWGNDIIVKTYVSKIGNSSCHITQEAWQDETQVAQGVAVMIYFDYKANRSMKITDEIRQGLEAITK